MSIDVNIDGTEEVISNINKFGKKAQKELKLAMHRVVIKIKRDAKALAPVDTGHLKSNIVARTKGVVGGVVGVVHSKAEYSIHQEFGTHKMDKHPFMQPAFKANIKYMQDQFKLAVVKATLQSTKKGS